MVRKRGGWIFVLAAVSLGAGTIDQRYATNANCQACHMQISKQWETSRHAHSHFTKNDLYDKSIRYLLAHNILKTREELVVECAKCHNPRIEKRKINNADKLGLLLEIDTETMDKMINSATMRNGINCIVCHNVEEIHLQKENPKIRGFDAVKFGPQGIMFGPFDGAKSPYHLTRKQNFFVEDPNRLCFVCHYSDRNAHGVEIYATGREYEAASSNGGKLHCIECHMSGKKEGVASNYRGKGGMVERRVRDHLFASIDNSTMYKKYLDADARIADGKVEITLTNRAPHKVPTGYGLRRLELQLLFVGEKDRKTGEAHKVFSAVWTDKNGEPTIPHLAAKKVEDQRIPAYGKLTESFPIPSGTRLINYKLIYRQIGKELAKKLGVSDPFFTRAMVLKNGVIEP